MRCPDCNKFVSMENGEPEVNLECNYEDGFFRITGDVRHTRNCADCGTELKSMDHSVDYDESLENVLDGVPSEKSRRLLKKAFVDGEGFELEADNAEVDESGGGRYAKNIITIQIPAVLAIDIGEDKEKIEFRHEFEITLEAAASEYEECC